MATIITNNGNIQTAGSLNFAVSQSNNLKVDGLSAIYLTGSGGAIKVGINTVNPNFTLDVNGNTNIAGNISASGNITAQSFTGSFSGSINNAVTSSYAINAGLAQNLSGGYISASGIYTSGNTVVGGDLTVTNNLTVLGTSSVVNITSSNVNIGANKVVVNAYSPFQRYAGLSAVDSGSGINVTSSLYWDSLNNYWLFQGESGPGQLASSSIIIGGPISSLGSETTLTINTIPKAVTDSNIGDSKLTDDGTNLIYSGTRISASSITASTLNATTISGITSISATSITSSFTGSLVGSLTGTASWATNAVTAAFVTASNVVGVVTSASYARTSSYAEISNTLYTTKAYQVGTLTASNIDNNGGDIINNRTITSSGTILAYNIMPLLVSGAYGTISGSTIQATSISGALTGSHLGTSSWATNALTASYISSSNIFGTVTSASYALTSSNSTTASFALNLSTGNSYQITNLTASNISASGTITANNLNVTLSISGASLTGSHLGNTIGTASWASNSVSSSYALTSSFATTAGIANSLITNGTYQVGTISASNAQLLSLSLDGGSILNVSRLTMTNAASIENVKNITSSGTFSGSNIIAASITASLLGTASWATNAVTASYVSSSNISGTVTSASYALTSSNSTTASFANSLNSGGSYTLTVLTASVISASGTITANNLNVATSISGASITGSLTGSLIGSLTGTASWATNALTAAFVTASNISGVVTSASYAGTSSYAEIANTLYTNKAYQVGSLIVNSINIDGTNISGVTNITSSGTISAGILVANDISGGIGLISGSNIIAKTITGSLTGSVIGSLTGTASWATNALTSAFITASNISGTVTSASYSLTSSYSIAAGNAYIQNGNSFGAIANLGTNDNFNLVLETNNTGRLTIDTGGGITSSAKIVPAADANSAYTLGTTSNRWNDIFAVQSTIGALFETGLTTVGISKFKTGTVLSWKDSGLIPCEEEFDEMVMGVAQEGKDEPIVFGAEPILVTGKVNVGDYIVTSNKIGHGMGIPRNTVEPLQLFAKVIAQAVESGDGESYTIKAMIRKM